MTHIRSVTTAIHICFSEQLYTGKERDSESVNDYFGAERLIRLFWATKQACPSVAGE
jgi:hypothetical protein